MSTAELFSTGTGTGIQVSKRCPIWKGRGLPAPHLVPVHVDLTLIKQQETKALHDEGL